MPLALALSPHLDDAVFSCGGTLAMLARSGWRIVLATVFTRSVANPAGFALACQLDKGLAPDLDYMALRRQEDAAAAAILGIETLWLDLPEAPHRGYHSAAALFADPLAEDHAGDEIAAALRKISRRLSPDLILAPQAIGGHVDHVAVVAAIDAAGPGAPMLWWRDFPYVARGGDPKQPFASRMQRWPAALMQLDGPAAARKRDSCLAYASQIGFQFGGPDGLDRRLAEAGCTESFRRTGRLPPGTGLRDVPEDA